MNDTLFVLQAMLEGCHTLQLCTELSVHLQPLSARARLT